MEVHTVAQADNQLRRPAADVHDERSLLIGLVALTHRSEERQLRLLVAAQNPRVEAVMLPE